MKFFRSLFRVYCIMAAIVLIAGQSRAEEICIEDRGLDLNEEISIHYPVITDMENPELQEEINARILEKCGIRDYLARATQLISGGSLKVEWTGGIAGEVFSCIVSAEGAVETTRKTHRWTGCTIDLKDGHSVELGELFTDITDAKEQIEAYLTENVGPELSAHLLNSELLPIPERFCPERSGLTLLYDANQLCTLSDRAGDIRIGWYRLRSVLNLEENSILNRIGVGEMITLSEKSNEKLRTTAAEGLLTGIPVQIGENMQELTDRYHLLMDPDGYEDGRLFALEGRAFRGVYLMTDDLAREWENSRVQGIRMDEGCLWGLCIGETDRSEWLEVLGEPENQASISEEKAEANRLKPGNCDYYRCGDLQLRLYSDENGTLISVVLTE